MPRCCTHTLAAVLQCDYAGTRLWGEPHGDLRLGAHRNVIPPECEKWFRWTCCRNPYTRAASMYWYLLKIPGRRLHLETFEDFCECVAGRVAEPRRGPLWPMWQQANPAHFHAVVRFEHLMDDLRKLPFWNGPQNMRRLGASEPDKPLKDILTAKCVGFIRRWAGPDFEMFGYDLEPPV